MPRIYLSLRLELRPYAFNLFFFLEQENVWHSRYMIWQIFT